MHERRAHVHSSAHIGDWAADRLATFAGSWLFVGLHVAWFALWLVLHLDINLLTLIVSLEAIFLATFVLMNQNRQSDKDRLRDNTEAQEVELLYQINQEQLAILRTLSTLDPALTRRQSSLPSQNDGSDDVAEMPTQRLREPEPAAEDGNDEWIVPPLMSGERDEKAAS